MAVRLPVILIQSRAPSSAAQRMSEEVVGQLIGTEGIDLALVGPLSSLDANATDRLTLESLSGDLAVLDWQDPEAIVRGFVSADIDAERAAHPHDREAPVPESAKRRVFAFDMGRFDNAGDLVAALRELNQRRQVRTFSIGLGGPASGTAAVPVVGQTPGQDRQRVDDSAKKNHGTGKEPVERGPDKRESTVKDDVGGPATDLQHRPGSRSLDLDDLLDQLDRADP